MRREDRSSPGTVVGGSLLAGGLVLGWLAFATPFVRVMSPAVVRPTPEQLAVGGFIWALALVAPPCFAIVGMFRLSQVAAVLFQRPDPGPVAKAVPLLSDDYLFAPSLDLPDGRRLRNVLVGPFGLAVIGVSPPKAVVRRHGESWEYRRADGRWMPLEHPLERVARDAERLRRWIGAEERDFIVKVYAAFVTDDPTIVRTPIVRGHRTEGGRGVAGRAAAPAVALREPARRSRRAGPGPGLNRPIRREAPAGAGSASRPREAPG